MKFYTIGISCIGSGVGESVINSCRLSGLPLKTVGLGTNPFAYGAYACDTFDYTPTIYASDFVDKLIAKCKQHQIDLLIPGRDDEAFIYAKNRERFAFENIEILVASEDIISICRDKEKMSLELNPIVDVFVKCYQKDSIKQLIANGKAEYPFLAKPRSGFASMGVEIIRSEADLGKISDDHIVQELAVPAPDDPNYQLYMNGIAKNQNPQVSEISIQLVLSKEGEVIGKMASYNKLNNGVPIEILPYENEEIWIVVDKLLPVFRAKGLTGPLNIQGRLTKKGLKVFEMNPRFTGITGLRALMGFNEVGACIRNWLKIDNQPNKISLNPNRFGIRQTSDRVMALEKNEDINKLNCQINNINSDKTAKKTILITGASGYLGQCLVKLLLNFSDYSLLLIGRNREKLSATFKGFPVKIYEYSNLSDGTLPLGLIDIVIHTAFARPHCGFEEIASSLSFTNELFFKLGAHHVPFIINISSQSVYGNASGEKWTEDTAIAPTTSYGQAKHAAELLLEAVKKVYPHLKVTSVRLGTLAGGQDGLVPVDLMSKFVLSAKKGEPITLLNGEIEVERMDVRDAALGILQLLKSSDILSPVYNLSQGQLYKLKDIADEIVKQTAAYTGNPVVEVIDKMQNAEHLIGMDNERFKSTQKWQPQYSINDTIKSLIQYLN